MEHTTFSSSSSSSSLTDADRSGAPVVEPSLGPDYVGMRSSPQQPESVAAATGGGGAGAPPFPGMGAPVLPRTQRAGSPGAAADASAPGVSMPAPAAVLAKQKKLLDQSPEGVWGAEVEAAALEMATFSNGSPLALILDVLDERPELRVQMIGELTARLNKLAMRGTADHEAA